MKIIFLRHGESEDDIRKEFGGWADPIPTKNGLQLARKIAVKLNKKYPKIDKIYSSPLKRASIFAKVIADKLNLELTELVYLKERNTYGLLNGLNISKAKNKYPKLYKKFEAQEYIPGSERYDDFKERVDYLIKHLGRQKDSKTILCVTQGYLITTIIEEYLGHLRDQIHHGSYITCRLSNKKLVLIEKEDITFLDETKHYDAKKRKKFKTLK